MARKPKSIFIIRANDGDGLADFAFTSKNKADSFCSMFKYPKPYPVELFLDAMNPKGKQVYFIRIDRNGKVREAGRDDDFRIDYIDQKNDPLQKPRVDCNGNMYSIEYSFDAENNLYGVVAANGPIRAIKFMDRLRKTIKKWPVKE